MKDTLCDGQLYEVKGASKKVIELHIALCCPATQLIEGND